MASARPLREVFADLVGTPSATDDPAALLRDHGHPALPDDLVAEAVVSYADTAPVEVAEHLAPYVTAHSAVGPDAEPGDEPDAGWLDLLGTAPDVTGGEPADLDALASTPGGSDAAADAGFDPEPDPGLSFGTGAGPASVSESDDDAEGAGPDGLVEMLADPAELDQLGQDVDWTPAADETHLSADLTADESGGEPEPDAEPLG
jgi:hypothetical protein